MNSRAELTDLIDDNAKPSAHKEVGVANPEELADRILAAGYKKTQPFDAELLAEAKSALETLPANAVEAHHKQVITGLLGLSMTPHTITTIEELEALPLYSIVIIPTGQGALHAKTHWKLFGTATQYTPNAERWLPATVIHTPEKG